MLISRPKNHLEQTLPPETVKKKRHNISKVENNNNCEMKAP